MCGVYCQNIKKKCTFCLQPEMLQMLVEHGANLDAKTRNGETAFGINIYICFVYMHLIIVIKTSFSVILSVQHIQVL